ncbi:class I SAM-dependent methyltransferase [Mycobacterium sp.]|uniref:class I SAM-dependent methyltransferase n=1 Tax=Mycobacterium sp. TaxID=1785 RepID=UPI002C6C46E4|nr:class I SAM-dependent methyltransferase [Mycobacterium sp.]HTQ19161.1 class I SAM-dependent methyltransferase [Mycobacterium sp.]
MAEIGVYRGHFAARILADCSSIQRYYMVDPWRHLDGWNKPANTDDARFAGYLAESKANTEFAGDKRIILRGTTIEVLDQIPDGSLDFVYVDGDHTLRGISIDLINVYPKVRAGGWIGGDDFTHTVFQHGARFEPTLVFPFAIYFAEAVGARIFGLPHLQFLICKPTETAAGFEFVDLTESYPDTALQGQFRLQRIVGGTVTDSFSRRILAERMPKKVRDLIKKTQSR